MTFRPSQFGRFGCEVGAVVGFNSAPTSTPSEIDSHSASLLGRDTPAQGKTEDMAHWLRQRGYPERAGAKYLNWRDVVFRQLVAARNPQIALLSSNHQGCEPVCVHDFVPSTLHKPLVGWFTPNSWIAYNADGRTPLTNVVSDRAGKLVPGDWTPRSTVSDNPVEADVKLIWVLDQAGEILVAPEQLKHVKHSSLAAGCSVWAAGEIGFEAGQVRVVTFWSGHYVARTVKMIVGYKSLLKLFTDTVFRKYSESFMDGKGISREFEVDDN